MPFAYEPPNESGNEFREATLAAWAGTVDPRGNLYILGERIRGGGAIVKLKAGNLKRTDSLRGAFDYTYGAVWFRDSLWTLGRHSLWRLDDNLKPLVRRRINGRPYGIAPGPRGHVFVTVEDRAAVLEFDETGKQVDRVRLHGRPKDLAVTPKGTAVVVTADGVAIIDLVRMKQRSRVFIGGDCNEPREIEVVASRAVVSCQGSPNVAIVDIAKGNYLRALVLSNDYEEARAMLAIPNPYRGKHSP